MNTVLYRDLSVPIEELHNAKAFVAEIIDQDEYELDSLEGQYAWADLGCHIGIFSRAVAIYNTGRVKIGVDINKTYLEAYKLNSIGHTGTLWQSVEDAVFLCNLMKTSGIDALKLDVQGAELGFLQGCTRQSLAMIRLMIIEWHEENFVVDEVGLLSDLGFKLWKHRTHTDTMSGEKTKLLWAIK